MARRTRYTGGLKFYQALTSPTSKRVLHCYATHGSGPAASGPEPTVDPAPVRVLAINRARATHWEDGTFRHHWECPSMSGQDEWRRLGWAIPDESLPFGAHDVVDPDLAQFDHLPGVNSPDYTSHSTPILKSPAGQP